MSVPEPIKQKIKELSKKRPDKFAIILGNLYKVDPETGKKRDTLAKWQREYLLDQSKRIIVKTPRQAGKTLATALKALWRAWIYDKQLIILIAPKFEQTKIMFYRMIEFLEQPNNIIAQAMMDDIAKINYTGQIWFKNGSRIFTLSAAGDINKIRGYTAHMIVVDEAQSIPDDVFKILEPMLFATDGQMILIGTPLGFQGFFYQAWKLAEQGKVWKKYEADPFDRPWMSKEEIQRKIEEYRMTYGEIAYKREMLGLFSDDEGLFFDLAEVDEQAVLAMRKYPETSADYIIGIDPASSGNDETAIVALAIKDVGDERIYEMHRYWTFKGVWKDSMYREVKSIIDAWSPKVVIVDTIGLGDPVMLRIQEENPGVEVVGFKSVGRRRLDMYFDLKYLIAQRKLYLIDDEKLKRQFSNYKMQRRSDGSYTVKKLDTGHDDIVDALALAIQGAKMRYGIEGKRSVVVSPDLVKLMNEYFSTGYMGWF